jgi:hypothetical protein
LTTIQPLVLEAAELCGLGWPETAALIATKKTTTTKKNTATIKAMAC